MSCFTFSLTGWPPLNGATVEADDMLTLTLADPSSGTHLLVSAASTVVLAR